MAIDGRTVKAADGVAIAYSVSGRADAAVVCIHGGFADRSFWINQHEALSDRWRVIALDLAGHGDSGRDRREWSIPGFAQDVAAVIGAERPRAVLLVGNSLGGPVAVETALAGGAEIRGVIGVDTFHDLSRLADAEQARAQAEAWRGDFDGRLDAMLKMLLHPDVAPELLADLRRRMARTSVETAVAIMLSFGGYHPGEAARRLRVPLRCINGDLYPTKVLENREWIADFDAVTLAHCGHYPMLEYPEEFNRRLAAYAAELLR